MSKRRKRRVKSIALFVGEDPELWHYESLQDALSQNVDLIAQMILAGEDTVKARLLEEQGELPEPEPSEAAS